MVSLKDWKVEYIEISLTPEEIVELMKYYTGGSELSNRTKNHLLERHIKSFLSINSQWTLIQKSIDNHPYITLKASKTYGEPSEKTYVRDCVSDAPIV